MERINETITKYGTTWSPQLAEDLSQLYEPLHAVTNAKYAKSIKTDKGLKYGSDDHQRVDVYYNTTWSTGSDARPVIVFFHGGAFVKGDNDWTPESNLHGNIGYFFARNGYVTCLATYRLVFQTAHHPSGPQDIAAALRWVQANISSYGGGDPSRIVGIGHSAGGTWLATSLFMGLLDGNSNHTSNDGDDDSSYQTRIPPILRGAILLSAPLTLNFEKEMRLRPMQAYFGTRDREEIEKQTCIEIFRREFLHVPAEKRRKLPCEVLLLLGEYDSQDEVVKGMTEWTQDYLRCFGRMPLIEVAEGQNHMSIMFGVGLEVQEKEDADTVGPRLLKFVNHCTT